MANLNFYKANWSWPKDTEIWLSNMFKNKTILNFPCGMSKLGDIRVDIDGTCNPDVIADYHYPPFRNKSFDVVIMDPDYKDFHSLKWLLGMKDLARTNFVLCTPAIIPLIKGFKRNLYFSLKNNGFFIRIFINYTRKPVNSTLNDYPKYRNYKNKT